MNNTYYREIPSNNFFSNNQSPNQPPFSINRMYYQDKDITVLLNLNKGKKVCIYTSFKNSEEWKNKAFTGIVEEAYKDYLVLSDPKCGDWYIIPIKYIDYIKSEENINIKPNYYQTSN